MCSIKHQWFNSQNTFMGKKITDENMEMKIKCNSALLKGLTVFIFVHSVNQEITIGQELGDYFF